MWRGRGFHADQEKELLEVNQLKDHQYQIETLSLASAPFSPNLAQAPPPLIVEQRKLCGLGRCGGDIFFTHIDLLIFPNRVCGPLN